MPLTFLPDCALAKPTILHGYKVLSNLGPLADACLFPNLVHSAVGVRIPIYRYVVWNFIARPCIPYPCRPQ